MALLKPHFRFRRITDIEVDFLKKKNIDLLLLDVDNTLSTHHGTVLVDGLTDWLEKIQSAGIRVIILSNSKRRRVEPFATGIGLDYVSLGLKPLPFGYLKAIKRLCANRKQTAIIGDQLFTDSLGAHIVGIKSIILEPIEREPMLSFKIRRYFEDKLYKIYKF